MLNVPLKTEEVADDLHQPPTIGPSDTAFYIMLLKNDTQKNREKIMLSSTYGKMLMRCCLKNLE